MKQHTGTFSASGLIRCYTLPSLWSVYPGNKVMCKSGGPKMTVCEEVHMGDHLDMEPGDVNVLCMWEHEGTIRKAEWPLMVLTCWGAE